VHILGLIPARKGSKRIKDKNKKVLLDKPLIEWTIEAGKSLEQITQVLVSTDDPEIMEIAKKSGVLAPWLRPVHLSEDKTSSMDVIFHALDWYESNISKIDGVLLLQPTSPFRSPETLLNGIKLFEKNPTSSIIGVSKIKQHPSWAYKLSNGTLINFMSDQSVPTRSQDLESAYFPTGSFYLTSPEVLRRDKSFLSQTTIPLVVGSFEESIDIDTAEDFRIAELCAPNFIKEIK
jgi:CMP-N,N'-diacetyllegionaminic acid synthase